MHKWRAQFAEMQQLPSPVILLHRILRSRSTIMERRTPEYFIDKIILDRYKLTEPLGPGAGYLALDLHPVPSSSR